MIHRRHVLMMLGAGVAGAASSGARAETAPALSRITAYGFAFTGLGGKDIRLSDYAGRPVLVVNTASLCGYTPQYTGLQQLWTEFQAQGLMVIGVPSNDFGSQEPGGADEIDRTAHAQYGVTFPITAKTVVRGPAAHPFYRWAAAERPKEVPAWNFHKYLLGRDGYIADVFASAVEPTDTRVKTAIGRALTSA
ncbi:glutathione peroxidase [Bradyrhizobium sp. U87765 SZCCT0131]|uniref:glutathione peroxidase n=1 Tax=unclassified Bradyrhizobium TaxID=2631580 RepID=UPI001BACA217|nr:MULTISPECIES: glutathione peroxidase [unclassified Bradyrhizobium]MBR1220469.1 glutathione peroxidase [Bradyrhizobium sp. U87765 SZCCT0131]MBR1263076.1 glutathione peroxidase [Bradyrhizobium sp. U87765 SZCCT0134]MBR1307041.1 glutathione peroxidase [Bradyrhizobium sp. U87765 SZCCT0110]MBR1323071.1 glutathione peroxidase [Bradyrhizobium sp. U87765 SZCCT0109]MBR1345995.1 glutathione peroxidase [Bradyrhizobium sp. U87765 SZCCT0048]